MTTDGTKLLRGGDKTMQFRDDKTVTVYGRKFERARLVQGCLIYALLLFFVIFGIVTHAVESYVILASLIAVYASVCVYYLNKVKGVKKAVILSALRLLVLPTSMIG